MTRQWPALDIHPLDDLVQAALVDHDVAAIDEDAARVFFHSADARDRAAAALQHQFPELRLIPVGVADEDWAARSQANITAVRVGNIVIAPPWDAGRLTAAPSTEIIIQPSMGFGTGHHATTRLAIAASRLGAAQVLAIDDDPDAIASARENLDLNPGTRVTLGTLDLRRAFLRPFNVVMANLTGGLLTAAAPALAQLTAADGRLILSGFMESEEPEVIAAFASCELERRSQEDEWVCATLLRTR
jgi:ribosomal protein L11 methyltransferase